MASSLRTVLFHPRPLRSLVATSSSSSSRGARRAYATIPTKNPTPSPPLEPSQEQAFPIGPFYEAILNGKQPLPDVKPEAPATTVKEAAPKRGRPPKAPAAADPAATATASKAPTASPAATAQATAKEAAATAAKEATSSVSPPTSSSTSPPDPGPENNETATSTQEKAKVIFGTRLAGPVERAQRLAQMRARSRLVAGVRVPPKPEEPDNCCMSGCVNCVWDLFRDEMEEWALANDEAERRLAAGQDGGGGEQQEQQEQVAERAPSIPQPGVQQQPSPRADQQEPNYATSMDDDGGGSDTNWQNIGGPTGQGPGPIHNKKEFWNEELYKNVPVGIREFMKQEKRLKEKHLRDGTAGG